MVKDVVLQTTATRPVDIFVPQSESDQRFDVTLAKTDVKMAPSEVSDQTDGRVQQKDKIEAVHWRAHREQQASNDESANAGESNSSNPVATRVESENIDHTDNPQILDEIGDIATGSHGDPVDLNVNGEQIQVSQVQFVMEKSISLVDSEIVLNEQVKSHAQSVVIPTEIVVQKEQLEPVVVENNLEQPVVSEKKRQVNNTLVSQVSKQPPRVDPTLPLSQPNITESNSNNSQSETRMAFEGEQHANLTTNAFTGPSTTTEGSARLTGLVMEISNPVMTAPVTSSVLQGSAPPPQTVPVVESQLPNVDASDDGTNLSRVVRGLRSAVNQHGGSVTLRLHPPDFGFVRVQMNLQDGTVNATIQSENTVVRALLSQHLAHLRHSLETQGFFVERLSVQALQPQQVSTTTDQQADDSFRQQPEGRSRGGYAGRDGRKDQDSQEADEVSSQPKNFQQALVNEVV